MRFWFARDGEVPIREQLVTQVILGILGGDFAAGDRLPSTREMARRFRLHANTVSAAYRELERQKWVESRHGSGVYISAPQPERSLDSSLQLDRQISELFRAARESGIPLAAVHARLRHWLAMKQPDRFVLIEDDKELQEIVVSEMKKFVSLPVESVGTEIIRAPKKLRGAIVAALPSTAERVQKLLPEEVEFLPLRVSSVPISLAKWTPAKADLLIGIASRWPRFLDLARTMLVAAGFPSDCLVIRDARKAGWERSLRETAAVVCDSLTADQLSSTARAIVYPFLSEAAIADLRQYQGFLKSSAK